MKANVITCNSMIENGEYVGGYHELHEIRYLSGMEHLIATIDSIIKNNLLYGCEDTMLEDVVVDCDDSHAVTYIAEHCKDIFHYPNVKLSINLMTT